MYYALEEGKIIHSHADRDVVVGFAIQRLNNNPAIGANIRILVDTGGYTTEKVVKEVSDEP